MYSVNLIALLYIIGAILALDVLDYKYSRSKPFAVLNNHIHFSHMHSTNTVNCIHEFSSNSFGPVSYHHSSNYYLHE